MCNTTLQYIVSSMRYAYPKQIEHLDQKAILRGISPPALWRGCIWGREIETWGRPGKIRDLLEVQYIVKRRERIKGGNSFQLPLPSRIVTIAPKPFRRSGHCRYLGAGFFVAGFAGFSSTGFVVSEVSCYPLSRHHLYAIPFLRSQDPKMRKHLGN